MNSRQENNVQKVISATDTCTTNDSGSIGLLVARLLHRLTALLFLIMAIPLSRWGAVGAVGVAVGVGPRQVIDIANQIL
jgi:hypothetical protein